MIPQNWYADGLNEALSRFRIFSAEMIPVKASVDGEKARNCLEEGGKNRGVLRKSTG
jgi:hypothetical protein